jgi:hypothetical protein
MSKSLIFFSPFTKHFTDKYTNPLSIHNPPHFEQLSLTFVLESGSEECRVWVFDSNCWSTHPTCTCLRGKWSSHVPQPDSISPRSLIVKINQRLLVWSQGLRFVLWIFFWLHTSHDSFCFLANKLVLILWALRSSAQDAGHSDLESINKRAPIWAGRLL